MKSTIKIALAAILLAGASSMAMAQMGSSSSGTSQNAVSSGGAGTHSTAVKTGSASNSKKVYHNQNGYQGRQ